MSKKAVLVCGLTSLLFHVPSHATLSGNLAMVQDTQRQISTVHDSIFAKKYSAKCYGETSKSPRVYFDVLGYHSSFDGPSIILDNESRTLSKDNSNNIGGLFGIEKQFNEDWNLGTFTSFQYADCDFSCRSGSETINQDCCAKSTITGLYGRYCSNKWMTSLIGSFGYIELRNNSDQLLKRNKYKGWLCALSGQIAYNLLSQEDISFGPIVEIDGSYISVDDYVSLLSLGTINLVKEHIVKSLTTFIGVYGTKSFSIKNHKTLAYANAGWSCECLRSGNKYSYSSYTYTGDSQSGNYHQCSLPYLPRNIAKIRIGIKSFLNDKIEGDLAVGANFGSDYYNINGNVAINYQF